MPYVERMGASLFYYKGFTLRDPTVRPNLCRWFDALEQRETYLGTQPDAPNPIPDPNPNPNPNPDPGPDPNPDPNLNQAPSPTHTPTRTTCRPRYGHPVG